MTHKGCGGDIVEDRKILYKDDTGTHPALRCSKCDEEIIGDPQIEEWSEYYGSFS